MVDTTNEMIDNAGRMARLEATQDHHGVQLNKLLEISSRMAEAIAILKDQRSTVDRLTARVDKQDQIISDMKSRIALVEEKVKPVEDLVKVSGKTEITSSAGIWVAGIIIAGFIALGFGLLQTWLSP